MSNPQTEPTHDDRAGRDTSAPAKPDAGDARKAQEGEAKDEGAGKLSIPVEDLTTANDAGQG